MKRKIVSMSRENQGMVIRAVNGICLVDESWMKKRKDKSLKKSK